MFTEDKMIYTKEEVIRSLACRWAKGHKNSQGITLGEILEPFEESGFLCISNFLKLECGWVISHEEICPFCVDSLVMEFGSDKEKEMLKWVRSSEG